MIRLSEGRTSRPLAGKKVIVTRARHQASSLQEALESEGAEALLLPTIELSSNEAINAEVATHLGQLARYGWIFFTSPNAVEFFFAALHRAGLDARALSPCRIASLGPMTTAALEAQGIKPDFNAQRVPR